MAAPAFCPWCGKPRPNDGNPCPSCKGPSIRSVLSERQGRDPIAFFGEDVPTLLWDDPAAGGTGAFYVNPEKTRTRWQWQTGTVNNVFPFTLPANQRQKFRVRINPETGDRGDTEIGAFMLTSSGRVAIQPFIPLLDKNLSNGLVPSSLMFGTSQLQALLAQTLYALPSFDWTFDAQELSGSDNVLSPVFFGRRFLDSGDQRIEAARRAAGMSKFMHPYWLVPTTAYNNTSSVAINPNPTISIPSGASVTVVYSVPEDIYFDCWYVLDDSSTSVGANTEINDLFATIKEGQNGRNLIDVPGGSSGLSWRNFVATPTVPVTGMPSGGANTATGGVRAASLPGPGIFSHLFEPGTDIAVTFVSTDVGTITLRTAFVGMAIYAKSAEECRA